MSQHTHNIVVAESYGPRALAVLRRAGDVRIVDGSSEAAMAAALADADALLVRTYFHVTEAVLQRAPRLRVIGRAGVGLDNIDVLATARRGVTVVYTPAAATRSVAELTIGMMVALERKVIEGQVALREGRFLEARRSGRGRELHGLTLGIVGMGRIGRCVARTAALGFGMSVIYNDIVEIGALDFSAEAVSKDDLYRRSDVISLHVPLTDQTRGLIDAGALSKMQPSATLINTARGAVVDLVALADALASARLAGAALDVFAPEPPPPDHPILAAPDVLLSPHVGARTHAGLARMESVVEDVVRVLQGHPPLYPAEA